MQYSARFVLLFLILMTCSLCVLSRYNDNDNADKLLEDLKEAIDDDDDAKRISYKKLGGQFRNNDDPDDVALPPKNKETAISKQTPLKQSEAISSTTTKAASNSETEVSHSWTVFFILCILGNLNSVDEKNTAILFFKIFFLIFRRKVFQFC